MKLWRASLFLLFAAVARTHAQTPGSGVVKPLPEVKLEQDSDVKCLLSAVETGNPDTGPSTIVLKAPANCLVSWHYHTASEQLIVVQGNVKTEMDGMAAHILGPGGFAEMPSKVKHQFSCESQTACVMFVSFDRKYDIFWVKPSKTR
jgi:quercetin dioxygenase-like cupin family protein